MKIKWINVLGFLISLPLLVLFLAIGFIFRIAHFGFKTGVKKCDIFMYADLSE